MTTLWLENEDMIKYLKLRYMYKLKLFKSINIGTPAKKRFKMNDNLTEL